jgi:tRNA G46 methylase TrmB
MEFVGSLHEKLRCDQIRVNFPRHHGHGRDSDRRIVVKQFLVQKLVVKGERTRYANL